MPADAYAAELQAAGQRLAPIADRVSVRGDGAARFLLADRGDRALELARYRGGWWVECWAEDPETSVAERTYADFDAAVTACVRWFQEGAKQLRRIFLAPAEGPRSGERGYDVARVLENAATML